MTRGLMQELVQRQNGIAALFAAFERNGMFAYIERWASGETQPASVGEVEKGLKATGIIDKVALRIPLSTYAVVVELAVLIPILVHHFVVHDFVTTHENRQLQNPLVHPNDMLASALDRVA